MHFGDFPEEAILKCLSRDTIESQFMSCVKEADQFKHGGKIMSTMQKKEHNQLWLGLANGEQSFYTPFKCVFDDFIYIPPSFGVNQSEIPIIFCELFFIYILQVCNNSC